MSATISKIDATLDKATGEVIKTNPRYTKLSRRYLRFLASECLLAGRMISRGMSARVRIQVRPSGSSVNSNAIPLETFAVNKAMGRILLRRGGETVAAGPCLSQPQFPYVLTQQTGIVLELLQ